MSAEDSTSNTPIATPGGPKQKIKNPKRVEQGKRLSMISKEAKARKKLERESKLAASCEYDKGLSLGLCIAIVGAAAAVGSTYFPYKKFIAKDQQTSSKSEQTPSNTQLVHEQTTKRKPNFVLFD